MKPHQTSPFYPFMLAFAGLLALRFVTGIGSGLALRQAEARIREVGLSRRLGPQIPAAERREPWSERERGREERRGRGAPEGDRPRGERGRDRHEAREERSEPERSRTRRPEPLPPDRLRRPVRGRRSC